MKRLLVGALFALAVVAIPSMAVAAPQYNGHRVVHRAPVRHHYVHRRPPPRHRVVHHYH